MLYDKTNLQKAGAGATRAVSALRRSCTYSLRRLPSGAPCVVVSETRSEGSSSYPKQESRFAGSGSRLPFHSLKPFYQVVMRAS